MQCPIVKIKSADPAHGGYIVINETDFDPAVHERHIDPPPGLAQPPAAPSELPPADPLASLNADWRERTDLRDLVLSLTGRTVENQVQAVQVIEQLLAERG